MSLSEKQKQFLADALEYNGGTQTLEQVLEGLQSGQFQFWGNEIAAVVTEINRLPNKTFINIVLGGGDLNELKNIEAAIEDRARAVGFDGVTIIGRRGWGKIFPAYREVATVYLKEI